MNSVTQMINLAIDTLSIEEQIEVLKYVTGKIKAENIKKTTVGIRTTPKFLEPLKAELNNYEKTI